MSSTVSYQQNPSSVQMRHVPVTNDDTGNNSQRNTNRRSLSDKFRSLFRKNSSSPNRTISSDGRSAPISSRQRSTSPGSSRSPTEAPHLRAPIVHWPFRKKKTKLTSTTSAPSSSKTKTKGSRKTKNTSLPPVEISSPVYEQEHQSSIRGQNFVPRTPELAHGGTGRTQSSSSYETTTKGFRDYVILDHKQPSQQVPDTDTITPPPYTSDRSRSPSLNHQRLPDTSIEYSYHHETSPSPSLPPISDIEIIHTPQQQHRVGDTPSLTTTQILAEKTPVLPQTSVLPPSATVTTNSNQWKNTSSSSLNNTEMRSRTSSTVDVDVPKLSTPSILFGSTSNKKEAKRTHSQSRNDDKYNSSSAINNLIQPKQSYTTTYGSLPDAELMNSDNLSSSKPTKSIIKYPGLSAIVEHHIRPTSVHYRERPSIISQQTKRFDTSTATVNNYEQRQEWSTNLTNGSVPSPSSVHRHDGYIRPLTPPKSSLQPDVSVIHVDLNESSRGKSPSSPSRTLHYNSSESPIIYRSSTTIYTRDKHNYVDGGEIVTWSNQENDHIDKNKKSSVSIQMERTHNDHENIPSKITTNEYQYSPKIREQKLNENTEHQEEKYEISYEYDRQRQQQFLNDNRYSNNDKNLRFTRPLNIPERDKISDQSTRSYKDTERIQEPLNTRTPVDNSEVELRHYTLKRTDSYDGLGILISADIKTRLNHRIRDVEQASPGYRVGLRKNDRIINVNGINVENVEFNDVLILIKRGLNNNNLQFSVINESILT